MEEFSEADQEPFKLGSSGPVSGSLPGFGPGLAARGPWPGPGAAGGLSQLILTCTTRTGVVTLGREGFSQQCPSCQSCGGLHTLARGRQTRSGIEELSRMASQAWAPLLRSPSCFAVTVGRCSAPLPSWSPRVFRRLSSLSPQRSSRSESKSCPWRQSSCPLSFFPYGYGLVCLFSINYTHTHTHTHIYGPGLWLCWCGL